MTIGVGLTLLIILFYLVLAYLSFKTSKWVNHSEDYLIATRELSFFITTSGILAIGFASDITSMYSIFAVQFGYYAALCLGTVYIGWIIYGLLFTKMIRSIGTFTIGEWYELRFNLGTRIVMAVVLTLAVILVAAAGVTGMAQMLLGFAGWPVTFSVISMLLVIGIIMIFGGMWSVTVTDLAQTLFGYVVIPIVLVYLMATYGSFDWLQTRIPEPGWRLTFPGHFDFSLRGNSYITWAFMWIFTLIFGSPYYWLRSVAPRSDRAARNGFIVAGVLGLVLMVYFMPRVALYALAIKPEVFLNFGGNIHPAGAIGVLASVLPPVLGILLILAMLAATISTYTTAGMGGVATVSRDIHQRLFKPQATPKEMLFPTRLWTAAFIVVTGLISIFIGDVTFLMGMFLSFIGISSTLVSLAAFWPRMTSTAAFTAAITGLIATSVWGFTPALVAIAHQVWIAVGVSLVVAVVISLVTKPKYYAIAKQYKPEAANYLNDRELHPKEIGILNAIAIGANRFSDFIDTTQLDGQLVNAYVETMERHGCIIREGFFGAKFYTFMLTELGRKKLHETIPDQQEILEQGMDNRGLQALQAASKQDKFVTEDIALSLGMAPLDVVPVLTGLHRQGYLTDSGLFRRRLQITPKGREFLKGVVGGNFSAKGWPAGTLPLDV